MIEGAFMFVRVEINTPGHASRERKCEGPQISLGRDPAAHLTFDSKDSSAVSWQHARIDLSSAGASITDLNSSNGTFVNGQQLKGTKPIKAGDIIALGQTGPKIRVVEIGAPDSAVVAKTVMEKMLPQGMLTPPVGTKPLNVSVEMARPTNKRKQYPVGGIVLGLVALGVVVAAGLVVFSSQKKDEKKDDTVAEKPKDDQAKLDPAKGDAAQKSEGKKTPEDPKNEGKKVDGKTPEPPKPPKIDFDPTKPPLPPPASTGAEIYKRTLQSIGWVNVPRQFPLMSTGTGALVDAENRLFLTAYHVVEGATEARIFFPKFDAEGQPISVRNFYLDREKPVIGDIIVADAKRDLAVLKLRSVPPGVLPLTVAPKSIGVAHRVFTVGNPGASSVLWVYTEGTVRQIAFKKLRMDNKQDVEAWIVEAQFPINQGDSGGPVVNDRNELVGVNSSHSPKAQLMSNCVDIREIQVVLDQARRIPAPPGINRLP